jgi:TPR repeat protein
MPLFLSHGRPVPEEYMTDEEGDETALRRRTFPLVLVCAVALAIAVSAALAFPGEFHTLLSARFPGGAVPTTRIMAPDDPGAAAAAPKSAASPSQDVARLGDRTSVAQVAPALAPSREAVVAAYQNALLNQAPPAAPEPVAQPSVSAAPEQLALAIPQDHSAILQTTPSRRSPEDIAALVKRGADLIANGDLAAARLVLRKAADAGEARAAMALAGTYDPVVLGRLNAHGMAPDAAMARSWYEKASRLGSTEAQQRLDAIFAGR